MSNVMVIDDTSGIFATVAGKLRQLGHGVRICEPKDAIESDIDAQRPDAVLLNLQLQGMAGWHVLTQLKIRYPQLPVGLIHHREADLYDERLFMAECSLEATNLRVEKLEELVQMLLRRRERKGRKVTESVDFGRPASPGLAAGEKAEP